MKNKIDFNLIKILATFYGVVVFLTLVRRVYFRFEQGDTYSECIVWFRLFMQSALLDWLAVMLFMIMVSFATKKMFDYNLKFRNILLIHLLFSFIIGWFIFSTASIILLLVGIVW